MKFAVVRRTGFVLFAIVSALLPPTAALAQIGIAARYPGDKNITADPDVIFADDFESYTAPSQLTTNWSGAGMQANLRIATEPGNYYAGSKALEMKLPISTTETLNRADKKLAVERDQIFFRAYMKWDEGYSVTTSGHNGLAVRALSGRGGSSRTC